RVLHAPIPGGGTPSFPRAGAIVPCPCSIRTLLWSIGRCHHNTSGETASQGRSNNRASHTGLQMYTDVDAEHASARRAFSLRSPGERAGRKGCTILGSLAHAAPTSSCVS